MYPQVFFNKYLYQLTSDSFCVLLRLYNLYLENQDKKEIEINSTNFKKILTNIEYEKSKWVWAELEQLKLVNTFSYVHNSYELNLSQICIDSDIPTTKDKFRIIIKNGKLIKRKELKPQIPEYVNNFVSKYDSKLQAKIMTMVEGVIQYLIKAKNKTSYSDMHNLLMPFVSVDDEVINKVCDIYNNKISAYGKVHFQYIHGILRNVEKGKTIKSHQYDYVDKYKKEFEDEKKKFALKLVLGKVQDNVR